MGKAMRRCRFVHVPCGKIGRDPVKIERRRDKSSRPAKTREGVLLALLPAIAEPRTGAVQLTPLGIGQRVDAVLMDLLENSVEL